MEPSADTRWVSRAIDATGVGFCVAASITVYALGIAPLIEEKVFVVTQRHHLRAQRKTCAEVEASAEGLTRQLAEAERRLSEGQIRLEPSSRTNARVAALAVLLGEHGVEIDDVEIREVLPSSRCRVVPISIAGRGKYQKAVTLIHELNRTFADTSLAKFELLGNPGAPGQPAKIKLDVLWYTSPELQASAPSSVAAPDEIASGLGALDL